MLFTAGLRFGRAALGDHRDHVWPRGSRQLQLRKAGSASWPRPLPAPGGRGHLTWGQCARHPAKKGADTRSVSVHPSIHVLPLARCSLPGTCSSGSPCSPKRGDTVGRAKPGAARAAAISAEGAGRAGVTGRLGWSGRPGAERARVARRPGTRGHRKGLLAVSGGGPAAEQHAGAHAHAHQGVVCALGHTCDGRGQPRAAGADRAPSTAHR